MRYDEDVALLWTVDQLQHSISKAVHVHVSRLCGVGETIEGQTLVCSGQGYGSNCTEAGLLGSAHVRVSVTPQKRHLNAMNVSHRAWLCILNYFHNTSSL